MSVQIEEKEVDEYKKGEVKKLRFVFFPSMICCPNIGVELISFHRSQLQKAEAENSQLRSEVDTLKKRIAFLEEQLSKSLPPH